MVHDEHLTADALDFFHVMARIYHSGPGKVEPSDTFENLLGHVLAVSDSEHRSLLDLNDIARIAARRQRNPGRLVA